MSGFFGSILGAFEGGTAPSGSGHLVDELVAGAGGVSGIMDKFNQAGLGDKVASWVGSNPNIPLMAHEVLQVFPQDQLEALAEKHGVPAGMVASLLAHVLPQAVSQSAPPPPAV